MGIPVFYNSLMVSNGRSLSPSAGKPKMVVEDWLARELDIDLADFSPVIRSALRQVHDAKFVDGVLSGELPNGHGNHDAAVANSCLWTCGSMVAAAEEAMASGVACSPSSGFHHASYSDCHGFCTFNGLALAAVHMLDKHPGVHRVGILDMDYHFGDGTMNIIQQLAMTDQITQVSGLSGDPWQILDDLPGIIDEMECDLLLYQAGADMHIDDPLGGLMDTDQLRARDTIVFRHCKRLKLPVAWNLAGGYQIDKSGGIANVLELHRNTMQACIAVFGEVKSSIADAIGDVAGE